MYFTHFLELRSTSKMLSDLHLLEEKIEQHARNKLTSNHAKGVILLG